MNDAINAEQILAFRAEAKARGSAEWASICDAALAGDVNAWNRCADGICALEWPWTPPVDSSGRAIVCAHCGRPMNPADGWEVCSEACAAAHAPSDP